MIYPHQHHVSTANPNKSHSVCTSKPHINMHAHRSNKSGFCTAFVAPSLLCTIVVASPPESAENLHAFQGMQQPHKLCETPNPPNPPKNVK
eukprot:1955739-Amphidinium_carterae.2